MIRALPVVPLLVALGCASPDPEPATDDPPSATNPCDYGDMEGTWIRQDLDSPFPNTFFELDLTSGTSVGDVVGSTHIYEDGGDLCLFEVTCEVSRVAGYTYVYNTYVEGASGCIEGGYHLRTTGGELEVVFNRLGDADRLGNETWLMSRVP